MPGLYLLVVKGGDRHLPSNYRSISQLEHDAKFWPKFLARRLENILSHILHPYQIDFVKGRSICYALSRFQDLRTLAQRRHRRDRGMTILGFSKAFDSLLLARTSTFAGSKAHEVWRRLLQPVHDTSPRNACSLPSHWSCRYTFQVGLWSVPRRSTFFGDFGSNQ